MPAVGLIPALALIAGAAIGIVADVTAASAFSVIPGACAAVASVAWWFRGAIVAMVAVASGFGAAGVALSAHAREHALRPALRAALDEEIGGFAIDSIGPEADHDPTGVRAVLVEDASAREGFVALRALVTHLTVDGQLRAAPGGMSLTVSGEAAARLAGGWRAGRTIEAPVAFRRPVRYLNEGVADFERALSLDGVSLLGSIKSGLLVEQVHRGSAIEELAGEIRAHVRGAVSRWVSPHHAVAGAIVTAVLIGDRTGLPDDVRERLQAAGTYHVIAISGGNIAILVVLALGSLMLVGVHGRAAAVTAILILLAYAQVATAGPSVWRATLMAVLYLGARLLDHRTAPWQATATAASAMVAAHPLDLRDPGFLLTFGATAALLEGARRGHRLLPRHRVLAWIAASVAASLAAEITLLPISAQVFSRVTSAGLVLNLVAVPVMGVAQVAGIVATVFDRVDRVASVAGWVAAAAAAALVESARLVDVAPWLSARVPPPGPWLIAAYYAALMLLVYGRWRRVRGLLSCLAGICLLLVAGVRPYPALRDLPGLRLTMFDVGQGEALLLEAGGRALQIDAGGAPFGSGSFDIGTRVLAPALWARGIHRLGALLTTHGDPDHVGGAATVLREFAAASLWEGIDVPRHEPTRVLRALARDRHLTIERRRAGEVLAWGGVRLRVLHPPEPDWERPRVRNDDSVVLEVVHGDVAVLLTGDISAEVERTLVPRLTRARVRVLKVAHHGSRTSTSHDLLDAWQPQVALVSAGRGNTFGHPTAEVIGRLESVGAAIYRTDRHGQITLDTDGRSVRVRTFVSHREHGEP